MYYDNLIFSEKLANQRMALSENILGKKTVRKLLTYALFLLGVLFLNYCSR